MQALLDTPHTAWGEIRLNKSSIKVAGVRQGVESELRHFLKSVVLQANADIQPETPEEDAETGDAGEEDSDVDEQMTATFRAFAQQQED